MGIGNRELAMGNREQVNVVLFQCHNFTLIKLYLLKLSTIIQAIISFYKSYCIATLLATICCVLLFKQHGMGILGMLLWLKAGSGILIALYRNKYRKHEYFYYYNLGISKTVLWLYSSIIDILLLIILMFVISFT